MSTEAELFARALELPEERRAELVRRLVTSLTPDEKEPGYDEAWAAEIEQRSRDLREGRVELFTWEEVRDRILKSLSQKSTS